MRLSFYIVVLASCFGAAAGAQARAQEPLADHDLAVQTGGLKTPTGIEFNFGATVNTYVDGEMALQTQLTWTDEGVKQNQTSQQSLTNGDLTIPGLNGETVVIHDVAGQRIANLVLNTADNRDIRQDTAVSLAIADLSKVQADLSRQRVEMQLNGDIARALTEAAR